MIQSVSAAPRRRPCGLHAPCFSLYPRNPMRLRLQALFPPRYTALGLCLFGALLVAGQSGAVWPGRLAGLASPAPALSALGLHDLRQTRQLGAAQLPGHRPPALPAGIHPPRDAPVFHRKRQRSHAVFARPALAGLPARQGRAGQPPLRHPAGRGPAGLRMDQPLDGADHPADARLSHLDRRPPDSRPRAALHPALPGQRVQHLGHELWRAVGQRHPGAQRRAPSWAASRTTPAKARSRRTTGCTAAT